MRWERVRKLSSPDWQAPLWIAAVCLRMLADRSAKDACLALPGEKRLLMSFFAAAAVAVPDAEGLDALLDLSLQVVHSE